MFLPSFDFAECVACLQVDVQGNQCALCNPTYIQDSVQSKEESELSSKYHQYTHTATCIPLLSNLSGFIKKITVWNMHTFHGILCNSCGEWPLSWPYMDIA